MMKTPILAAVVLLTSAFAATAETGPANSTNQHLRDTASFYANIPDAESRAAVRVDDADLDGEVSNRHGQRRAIAR